MAYNLSLMLMQLKLHS